MFCPRCSAENAEQQKFCRQCGLLLTSVQWLLTGKMDTLIEKVVKGENSLSGGAVTLAIFALVALASIFLSSGRSISGAANLILGLLIAGPMIYLGAKRLESARKIIEGGSQPESIAEKPPRQLPTAPATDPLLELAQPPASVTEHTTYHLNQPDEAANRPSPGRRQSE